MKFIILFNEIKKLEFAYEINLSKYMRGDLSVKKELIRLEKGIDTQKKILEFLISEEEGK